MPSKPKIRRTRFPGRVAVGVLSVFFLLHLFLRAQDAPPATIPTLAELEQLVVEVASAEDKVAYEAYRRIVRAGNAAAVMVPSLIRIATADDAAGEGWAIRALGELGPAVATSAVEPLLARLAKAPEDGTLTSRLVVALIRLRAPPARLAEAVKGTLGRDRSTKERGVDYLMELSRYEPTGEWAIPIIAASLASNDSLRLRWAADALAAYGERAVPLVPRLIASIDRVYPPQGTCLDPEVSVVDAKRALERAIGPQKLGKELALVERLFEASTRRYRCALLAAIARLGPSAREALPRLVEATLKGKPMIRPDALRTVAMVDAEGKTALPLALRALEDQDPLLRLAAIDALRMLRAPAETAREPLLKRLPSARPYELAAAVAVLRGFAPPSKPELDELIAAMQRPDSDWWSADAALRLGEVAADDVRVIEALRTGAKSSSPWLAWLCIDSLGRRGARASAAVDDLAAVLGAAPLDPEMDLWMAAKAAASLDALGRIGSEAVRALPAIQAFALSYDRSRMRDLEILAGVSGRDLVRAAVLIRPPAMPALTVSVEPEMRCTTPWFAPWHLERPDKGRVRRIDFRADGSFLLEFEWRKDADVEWSNGDRSFADDWVMFDVARAESAPGIVVRVIDEMNGEAYAQGCSREGFALPERHAGEIRFQSLELDRVSDLVMEFTIRRFGSDGETGQRWRGGFTIVNPWAKAPR